MNTPPLLLAAAALLWGWQTGWWAIAIPVAALVELPRFVSSRWHFSAAHYNRIADFCAIVAVIAAVFLYVNYGNPRAIKLWFVWLPMAYLPLASAQAYGAQSRLDVSVLFWSLRRRPLQRPAHFNFGYLWFALWLLGASAANASRETFYAGISAVVLWALWTVRPRRQFLPWLALAAVGIALGYAGHIGLSSLQLWLETNVADQFFVEGRRTDPYESRTDLGHLGEIKSSGKILLRVIPDGSIKPPLLLHRASYNSYGGRTWTAHQRQFDVLQASGVGAWRLGDDRESNARVTVHDETSADNPVLSLPPGASRIEELKAIELRRNPLGTVQVEIPPGRFEYRVAYSGRPMDESAPTTSDVSLPPAEAAALRSLLGRIGVEKLSDAAIAKRIREYFFDNFSYTTYQPSQSTGISPLMNFLEHSHAGHCEYFATATVLLLRAAGIPARYATGFSVQEYSERERGYIVRQRHAHAWVRAYVAGAWQDIDTTPPQWFEAEASDDSPWTRVADLWSWLVFSIQQSYDRMTPESRMALWAAIALAVLVWVVWRLFGGHTSVARIRDREVSRAAGQGADSDFYAIERRIATLGHPREASESFGQWIERIARAEIAGFDAATVKEILRLHYRYRFDPAGIGEVERGELRARCQKFVAAIGASAP